MKKSQNIGESLAYLVVMLALGTIWQLVPVPTWAQAAPANQNTPTDTPIPVRTDDRSNNNNLWWLLLIPAGGLLWALSGSSRRKSTVEPTVNAPMVPTIPVTSVDPALDVPSPQSRSLAAETLPENNHHQTVTDIPVPPVPQLSDERAPQPTTRKESISTNHTPDRVPNPTEPEVIPTTSRVGSPVVSNHQQVPEDRASTTVAVGQPAERIQLLEERLVVDLHKRKVGEVIVRKEIETRLVQVPIRREILIVEQVNPELKQLAVVDLGEIADAPASANDLELAPTVVANFTSPTAAIEFLKSISDRSSQNPHQLQMNIVLTDADAQAFYREWQEHRSLVADAESGAGSSKL